MCYTQVPEHDLVEMDAGGLDYSIKKKLYTKYLRDIAQLVNRVRQVKHLKEEKLGLEKDKINRHPWKEKVVYVKKDDNN